MKKLFLIASPLVLPFSLVLMLALSTTTFAAIYKSVDASGRVTYTNIPTKNAEKLDLDDSVPVNSGRSSTGKTINLPSNNTSPSDFPKVDSDTQTQRDGKRKDILSQELNAERKALEEAKQAYKEGESNPEMNVGVGGKRFRNMPKFEEKMQRLDADVKAHERNVKLLEKELAAAK